ncbi:serine protease [candidate division KSB1 bacterium]
MKKILILVLLLLSCGSAEEPAVIEDLTGEWYEGPPGEWPPITMINNIAYADTSFPVAGCGFLLDIGTDTLAVTAKHVLTYFKSGSMSTVSFGNSLKSWKMFPKDKPDEIVIIDKIINENDNESIMGVGVERDWVLFSVKEKSEKIQPIKFRTEPLVKGEPVYIVGWRYTDENCSQVIYKAKYEESVEGAEVLLTELLQDNKMPGLSGSPVIDSKGRLIGIMSKKFGKKEKAASTEYPLRILKEKNIIVK